MLGLVAIGALSPVGLNAQHCGAPATATPYVLRFFTPVEHRLLEELMEIILPVDDHSPGAREARTADFADWMVANSDASTQRVWRSGLKLLRPDNLAQASAREENPEDDLERFYVRLKNMTIDAYYTSATGIHQDLNYQGNQFLRKFEGCDHPEHQDGERPA